MTAQFVTGMLEWRYPPSIGRPDEPIIVVLGGGVSPPDTLRKEPMLNASSLQRCLKAIDLYRAGPRCPVLITGGKPNRRRPGPSPAEAMRDVLLRLGMHESDITVEKDSRSTYENAVKSAKILRDRNIESITLITDAIHMERGARCFRAQGIQVTPAGCYHHVTQLRWGLAYFLPSAEAAFMNQEALHEWIGLLWYKLNGRI
jgi:uncharacterized SAM-binding protein YcdF (DUF218 family)